MDITLSIIVVIAGFVLFPLVLLFIGGRLIRRDMDRVAATGPGAPKARSWFTGDLQGLEDALVEFFASSKASSGILTVLAAHGKPVAFKVLVEEIRTEQERRHGEDLPTSALRTVLSILQVIRLVRMNRDGFSITDLGREVYRRMNSQLKHRTQSTQVHLGTVRHHGRRDHSIATSRASCDSPLADRISAGCR